MIINRLLKIILVILSIAFIILEVLKVQIYGDVISASLLVLLTILYMRSKLSKRPYLLFFLITFTISEVLGLVSNFVVLYEDSVDYLYYVSNYLYMLSYIFLILRCTSTMVFKRVLKQFPVTLIILVILGIFCVTLITETAQTQLSTSEYITEFLYNVVVMTLLSVALVNYMDKGDNKSMLFFIGTMFIFFSEMLQLAYYYIANMTHLAAIYSIFLVLAFTFFYLQSQLKHQKITEYNLSR
ncbi:hypothetical protein SAMN05444148_2781 [Winogradskyella jejuensis]|uniref:YhhN-like protein n=1 Tax=Winogradskyella jejuensis TaxID=1089305 RepID=A0A1M5VQM0_9FLAO|nr:hypothetical protein SAMN05444148_2781 [Winogradskyella jejuensis]